MVRLDLFQSSQEKAAPTTDKAGVFHTLPSKTASLFYHIDHLGKWEETRGRQTMETLDQSIYGAIPVATKMSGTRE